jgi:hypothetical protein
VSQTHVAPTARAFPSFAGIIPFKPDTQYWLMLFTIDGVEEDQLCTFGAARQNEPGGGNTSASGGNGDGNTSASGGVGDGRADVDANARDGGSVSISGGAIAGICMAAVALVAVVAALFACLARREVVRRRKEREERLRARPPRADRPAQAADVYDALEKEDLDGSVRLTSGSDSSVEH